ncbi:SH3 domain-containing protein [Ruminococcaceae bacterium YRB3002]|nr:SH3 domain-containing protein [Ruminococcaceae bacterium YRB3002]
MGFRLIPEGFKPTKERVVAAMSVISVVLLCAMSGVAISALLEAEEDAARHRRDQEVIGFNDETSDTTTTTTSDTTETSESSEVTTETTPPDTEPTETHPSTSDTSESSASSSTSASATSTTTTSTTTTSTTTTRQTTAATTTSQTTTPTTTETTIGERTYNAIVYATSTLNLRTGPGTSYESIRQLKRGDQIDVVGITTNGWYKTIRGNYVNATYTQTEPINTPTPKPKPATSTPKPTKKPTATPTPKPVSGNKTLVGTFSVTFYIPVNGNRTASGTTATMGRTVAANKNDFPFGTVIYVENDPLGGDGYYTIEDRGVGAGVIDIFVDERSDIPSYGVTTRKVYIVTP